MIKINTHGYNNSFIIKEVKTYDFIELNPKTVIQIDVNKYKKNFPFEFFDRLLIPREVNAYIQQSILLT
jgi:hypothetical protein